VISLIEGPVSSVVSASSDNPVIVATKAKQPLKNYMVTGVDPKKDKTIKSESENIAFSDVSFFREAGLFPAYSLSSLHGPVMITPNSMQKIAISIEDPDLQYIPDNNAAKSADRWSIGAMASPTYYSRFSSGNNDVSKQLIGSEKPLISYSGGVAFTYKVSKRFSVQSGLYYSSLAQEVEGINSFGGFRQYVYTKGNRNFEVLTASGTVYTTNGDVFLRAEGPVERIATNYTNDVFDPKKANLQYLNNSLRQNFSYLELPVVLRYKLIDKTIDFNLIGGLSYNMLVNNSVYTMIDGAKYQVGKTEGLNPISLSSSIGMGMEYSVSNNLSLNLEPTFRYYMNPFNQTTGSKVHPYSFGIFSGLSYKF
jgi:hypothetical protein